MNAHAKGLYNQRKSKKHILAHPELYGSLTPERVFITKSSRFGGDMFCSLFMDRYGVECKAGWDIITMPIQADNMYSFPDGRINIKAEDADFGIMTTIPHEECIYLIQVKTNKFPEGLYMKALQDFKVPFYVKKQIHVWEDRKKEPIITDL